MFTDAIVMKVSIAKGINMRVHTHTHTHTQVTEEEVVKTIEHLNEDHKVNAILLQLPLDSTNQIDSDCCTNTIAVNKVSGLVVLLG